MSLAGMIEELPAFRERASDAEAPKTSPVVLPDGTPGTAAVHAASSLKVGEPVTGPALIEGYSSTTYVPPAWAVSRDAEDNLIMTRAVQ